MKLFLTERSGELYRLVLQLAGIFSARGGRALLVGGSVRDALLGRTVKDFDIEVHGLDAGTLLSSLEGVCEVDAVGMSFGVIKVKHREIDITLPRKENKTGAGHRGFLVETDPKLGFAEAAARRDFTVNAIMYDPLTDELIDPWNGADDLKKGILRHVSEHFSEDPLRVLRGMQFAARLGFRAAPETLALCAELDQNELAVERIGTEWEKLLLQGKSISAGLEFLKQCRWIRFYPELDRVSRSEKWPELVSFADRCAALRPEGKDRALLFMASALTVPCGADPDSAAEACANFCRRLWNREELIARAALLVRTFREYEEASPGTFTDPLCRRLALKLRGLALLALLFEGAGKRDAAERLRAAGERLGVLDAPPALLLTGRHGIAAGMKPGPAMGKLLGECFEAQLDGLFTDLAGAEKFLRERLREQDGKKS